MNQNSAYLILSNKFEYFGVLFDNDLRETLGIKYRIHILRETFKIVKWSPVSIKLDAKNRIRIYGANVVNILLWDCIN